MLINCNALPIETSHTSLDIFERPRLLVNFDGSFEQKIGPMYPRSGPTLEFELKGDRTSFIDFTKHLIGTRVLYCKSRIHQFKLCDWRRKSTRHASFCQHYSSLFSDCTVTAQGVKVSSAKWALCPQGLYWNWLFTQQGSKNTWLECQGYSYESNPSTHTLGAFTKREAETRSSATVIIIGRVASEFFLCEKHLVSGAELRISFLLRTRPDYCLIYDDAGKDCKVNITQASLYIRKMTLTENAYSTIETPLAEATARYRYTEIILIRTFLIGQNSQSWDQENVFAVNELENSYLPCQPMVALWAPKQPIHSTIKNLVSAA